MKIGIYSDVHISRNSSIMPMYDDESNYTLRLKNCINSMNSMYDYFITNDVDLIINCGDTFNSHTLTADEIKSFFEIKREIGNNCINECMIIGNHDKFNDDFSSVDVCNIVEQISVVQKYSYIDARSANVDIYMMSYFEAKEFNKHLEEMLLKYPRQNSKAILFMHGDIDGSLLYGNLRMEHQISKAKLIECFDLVINGHIHCMESIYNKANKQILNIGSLTTHSFADSNKHVGHFAILDTDSMNVETINSSDQIVFRTYEVLNESDVENLKEKLLEDFKKIIKIKCKYELKDDLENMCQNEEYKILKYKFIFIYNSTNDETDEHLNSSNIVINDSVSITEKFLKFIKVQESLKYPIEKYESILKEIEKC